MRNKFFYYCLTLIFLITVSIFLFIYKERKTAPLKPDQEIIWHERYKHIDPKTGYRTSHYQGALPPYVPGAERVDLKTVKSHFENKSALFLDVMAHTGTGPDPIDGYWRLSKPRKNIPGSVWLADVGTGTLTNEMQHYFQSNLEELTGGDKSKPVIMYCTAGCWMAWNAVKRAATWGYTNLLWFPEGSDDWAQANLPLVDSVPIPVKIED